MSDLILPDNLPGLNLKHGLILMGGSKDKYINLLEKFFNNHKTSAAEIRKYLADNDIQSAYRTAHTLKGVSGNIGAEKLCITSSELENSLKNNNRNGLNEIIDKVENALYELLDTISYIAEKYKHDKSSKKTFKNGIMNMNKVMLLMKELKNRIDGFYSDSIEVLNSLKEEASNSNLYPELLEIEKFLEKYDFEKAGVILQKLMANLNIS